MILQLLRRFIFAKRKSEMLYYLSELSDELAAINTHDELVNISNRFKKGAILGKGFTELEKAILHDLNLDSLMEEFVNINTLEDCWCMSKKLSDVVCDRNNEIPFLFNAYAVRLSKTINNRRLQYEPSNKTSAGNNWP